MIRCLIIALTLTAAGRAAPPAGVRDVWEAMADRLFAPVELDIPAEIVATGQYVRFTPKTDAVSVTYVGLDGIDPFPSEDLKDPRRFLLDARGLKDVRLRFVAIGAGKDGAQVRRDFNVVIGKPPGPGPTPGPGPGPLPPPVPPDPGPEPITPSDIWVVLIEETGKAARDRLGWLSNPTLAAAVQAAGNHWRIVDQDVVGADGKPPADVAPYITLARKAGVPQLFLVDAAGKTRWAGAVPKSPEELAALVKKYRGGN